MGLQHANNATFGHAVNLDKAAWPALKHIRLQFRRKGRAGAKFDDETAQIIVTEISMCH